MTTPLKVDKRMLPIVIYTATHKIEGFYHTFDDGRRLLDDLNAQDRDFIPLTDAKITKLQVDDGKSVTTHFAAVNVRSIAVFFPNPDVVAQSRNTSAASAGADSRDRNGTSEEEALMWDEETFRIRFSS